MSLIPLLAIIETVVHKPEENFILMKKILELNSQEARKHLLKEESYFNFDLPKYFTFQKLIDKVSDKIEGKNLRDFYSSREDNGKPNFPSDFENVNYIYLNNKDGKYAWRPYQLIHPALYVSLVHKITETSSWEFIKNRFKDFQKDPKIKCFSIPLKSEDEKSDKATNVSNWWHSIEQKSIELALDYEYVLHTDVSDCYGSIYTHSITWALHTKETGKAQRRDKNLLGNIIDKTLREMSFGQTNGIPQGSVLMDLIAEMVLGFADLELSERIQKLDLKDFEIIRYRDDYRVFTNNPQDGELIVKNITEILIDLGMRLNTQKTMASKNIVRDSIKPDKLYWIYNNKPTKNFQEHLLLIHNISEKFPNSGSLTKALNQFYKRIQEYKSTKENLVVLISILIEIAYKSPRTYPIATAILSKLIDLLESDELRDEILKKTITRFKKIPNTGHIQIWLQRAILKIDRKLDFEETLCKKLNDPSIKIWNSDWLSKDLKTIIDLQIIVDEEEIEKINKVISIDEVSLFSVKQDYY